jgi:hypothetical protein
MQAPFIRGLSFKKAGKKAGKTAGKTAGKKADKKAGLIQAGSSGYRLLRLSVGVGRLGV